MYDEVSQTNNGVLTNMALTGTSSNFIEGNVNLNTNNSVTTNQTFDECDGFSITVGTNTYTQTGIYTNVLTSIDGCDSTVTTDLTVAAPLSSYQTINECDGYSITVGTNTYTQTGNYTDVLTSVISGCDSTVTTNLTINTIDNTVSQSSITLTANATGLSYQWLDCDNGNAPIAGETNIDFTPTENGNYSVEITDGNCVDTSACMPIASVGIAQNELNNSFKLFPNPANDQNNISLNNQLENVNIEIINMVGQTVKNLGAISQTITVNVSDLPKGTYLIKLQSIDGVAVKKFQKQ